MSVVHGQLPNLHSHIAACSGLQQSPAIALRLPLLVLHSAAPALPHAASVRGVAGPNQWLLRQPWVPAAARLLRLTLVGRQAVVVYSMRLAGRAKRRVARRAEDQRMCGLPHMSLLDWCNAHARRIWFPR
jgi:hypothetical protein